MRAEVTSRCPEGICRVRVLFVRLVRVAESWSDSDETCDSAQPVLGAKCVVRVAVGPGCVPIASDWLTPVEISSAALSSV